MPEEVVVPETPNNNPALDVPNEESGFIKAVAFLEGMAELFNAGILFNILGTFGIVFSHVGSIPIICDALIYFFRACANVTVAIGRAAGIEFPNRPLVTHPYHLVIDILAILLFLSAMTLIVASIFSAVPALPFAGWFFGLAGVTCSWIINHCQLVNDLNRRNALPEDHPEKLRNQVKFPGLDFIATPAFAWSSPSTWLPLRRLYNWLFDRPYFDRITHKYDENGNRNIITQTPEHQINAAVNSRNLYAGILFFVANSLLCGTATALFPLAAPILLFLSKFAGACLGVINVGRIVNCFYPSVVSNVLDKMYGLLHRQANENAHQPLPDPSPQPAQVLQPEPSHIEPASSYASNRVLLGMQRDRRHAFADDLLYSTPHSALYELRRADDASTAYFDNQRPPFDFSHAELESKSDNLSYTRT